jgi:hypothetical protein
VRYTVEASPSELTGVLLDPDVVIEVLRGSDDTTAPLDLGPKPLPDARRAFHRRLAEKLAPPILVR